MFPRSWFPDSYFTPSYWPKTGAFVPPAPQSPVDGAGGFILDMESIYPTDQMLMAYPDWVYDVPPAETRPLNEAVCLLGTAGNAIMLTGTAGPGSVAGQRNNAPNYSSQAGSPYDMQIDGPPITGVGNNIQLGSTNANTIRATGTIKTVCATPQTQISVSTIVTTPPDGGGP